MERVKSDFLAGWQHIQSATGQQVQFLDITSKDALLVKYEELKCQTAVVLAPELKKWSASGVNADSLIDFAERGGNLLLVASVSAKQPIRELAHEFGFDLQPAGYALSDGSGADKAVDIDVSKDASIAVIDYKSSVKYKGILHKLSSSNPLVFSVLKPSAGMKSLNADTDQSYDAKSMSAVSASQLRNNARVVFVGSEWVLTDNAGNDEFVKQLLSWLMQQKSVLRIASASHYKLSRPEQKQPSRYRIKDEIEYRVMIEQQQRDAKWAPFKLPSNDQLQLEIVMLDPYIRTNLVADPRTPGAYKTTVQLPDVYGVFTFKFEYKRRGLTYLERKDVVSIVPFRHDEYPRFLVAAYPYYVTLAVGMSAFFIFSVMYMYNGGGDAVQVVASAEKPKSR